jgi:DNA-binding NtrC family response regulator
VGGERDTRRVSKELSAASESPASQSAREGAGDTVSKRILIVDDEEAIVFAMQRYFRGRGFEVDCARELEEAEALLACAEYALVIADLRLTGVHGAEGLEILSFIRERCPRTRAILLTAYGSSDLEREARDRGVSLMLRKPQPLPDLAQAVLTLLEEGT